MISKVVVGSNFYGCCKYVCANSNRATVLSVNGVRDIGFKEMATDFEINLEQHPGLKNVVFHGILSFPHGENLDNNLLKEIAESYLSKIGFSNSPYAIVHHNDKRHCHLHIISSFVDFYGKTVDDSWIGLRAKKISQELTSQYNLIPADKKHLGSLNIQALNEREQEKLKVFLLVGSQIPKCKSLDDLKVSLLSKGVELQYKLKRGSDEIQGISFKIGNYTFKGSEVDRGFSYLKLKQAFENTRSTNVCFQNSNNIKVQAPDDIVKNNSFEFLQDTNLTKVQEDESDDFLKMLKKKKRRNNLTR